ncbi:MAG: transporter [Pirellulaceae bacterium]|nr:transporter [Pirellulaceae bacterium]
MKVFQHFGLVALFVLVPNSVQAQVPVVDTPPPGVIELLDESSCIYPTCGPKTLLSWSCCPPSFEVDLSEPLVTDRPDFTEASSVVGYGRTQLEMGYSYTYDNAAGTSVVTETFPEILLRTGILREWLELRVGWTIIDESTRVGGQGRTSQIGSDDLYLGLKIALTEQCDLLPEMAIMPQMTVPTGSGGHSNDKILPGVNWLYSWELSDCLSIAGSTQANRARETGGHAYTEFAQSAAIGYSIHNNLSIYGEWYGQMPHSALSTQTKHYFNGGFAYLVTNDFQVDFRAGLGLNSAADDYVAGAGFAWRF